MIWVIGDIHGQIDPLRDLLEAIKGLEREGSGDWRETIAEPVEKLIFTGDYIDHGPSSKEVVDLIESLDCEKVLLMGDHEDMALRFINQDTGFFDEVGNAWFYNGGIRTWAAMAEGPDVPELTRFLLRLAHERPGRWPERVQYEIVGDVKRNYYKAYSYKGFELPDRYVGFLSKLKYHHREMMEIGRGGERIPFDFFHGLPVPDLALAEQRLESYDDHERLLLKIAAPRQKPPLVLGVDPEADARVWLRKGKFADRTALWGRLYDSSRGYEGAVIIHGHTPVKEYTIDGKKFIGRRCRQFLARQFQTYPRCERLPFLYSRCPKAVWEPQKKCRPAPREYLYKTKGEFGLEAVNIDTGAAAGQALTALGLSSRHLGEGRLVVLTADLDGDARKGRRVRTRYLRFDRLGATAPSPEWHLPKADRTPRPSPGQEAGFGDEPSRQDDDHHGGERPIALNGGVGL
jgi:hypothetical protein